MAQIQLTQASNGAKFSVEDWQIIFVATDTLGASVTYITESTGQRISVVVSESPANIASISDTLIAITDRSSNSTYRISIDRIGTVDLTGTYVKFDYDVEGAAMRPIEITQTVTQFYTLWFEKRGDLVYAYDEVSATNDTISLAAAEGDVTANFTNGVAFQVYGSSTATMNTIWVTSSSAYGTKTVITVTGAIPSGASETGIVVLRQ